MEGFTQAKQHSTGFGRNKMITLDGYLKIYVVPLSVIYYFSLKTLLFWLKNTFETEITLEYANSCSHTTVAETWRQGKPMCDAKEQTPAHTEICQMHPYETDHV